MGLDSTNNRSYKFVYLLFKFIDMRYIKKENKPEKTIIKLPISNEITTKYTSLNIFRNSSQQAISSPAVFRSLVNDIYITVKFINDYSY